MEEEIKVPFFKRIFILFITFFKIGAFTFGGGYAMIPLIEAEVVEKHKWISGDDMLEIIAVAESTPGPVAINAATFVGYKVAGFWGAFCSTLGVVLPSFVVISILSYVLKKFEGLTAVKYAFFGIRAGVLALIFKALYSMYKRVNKYLFSYIIMAFALLSVAVFKISVLYVVVACAVAGIVYTFALGGKKK